MKLRWMALVLCLVVGCGPARECNGWATPEEAVQAHLAAWRDSDPKLFYSSLAGNAEFESFLAEITDSEEEKAEGRNMFEQYMQGYHNIVSQNAERAPQLSDERREDMRRRFGPSLDAPMKVSSPIGTEVIQFEHSPFLIPSMQSTDHAALVEVTTPLGLSGNLGAIVILPGGSRCWKVLAIYGM